MGVPKCRCIKGGCVDLLFASSSCLRLGSMKPEKSAFDLRVHLTCDCGTCLSFTFYVSGEPHLFLSLNRVMRCQEITAFVVKMGE